VKIDLKKELNLRKEQIKGLIVVHWGCDFFENYD
jgi:hypothetical protein